MVTIHNNDQGYAFMKVAPMEPEHSRVSQEELYKQMYKVQGMAIPELNDEYEPLEVVGELEDGTFCAGVKGETKHNITEADLNGVCTICTCSLKPTEEGEAQKPCVKIACGHTFHADCLRHLLRARWSTKNINFEFLQCPSCRKDIEGLTHIRQLQNEFYAINTLKKNVIQAGIAQMKGDKHADLKKIQNPVSFYFGKADKLSLERTLFYDCRKCHKAFFGGYTDCQMERITENINQEQDLVCRDCKLSELGVREEFNCKKHGLKFIQFKCDLCCDVATYHSAGNTYLCNHCFEDPQRMGKFNCNGNHWKCPLNMKHAHGTGSVPLTKCVMCMSDDERLKVQPAQGQTQAEIKLAQTLTEVDNQLKAILNSQKSRREMAAAARMTQEFRSASGSRSTSANSSRSGHSQRSATSATRRA